MANFLLFRELMHAFCNVKCVTNSLRSYVGRNVNSSFRNSYFMRHYNRGPMFTSLNRCLATSRVTKCQNTKVQDNLKNNQKNDPNQRSPKIYSSNKTFLITELLVGDSHTGKLDDDLSESGVDLLQGEDHDVLTKELEDILEETKTDSDTDVETSELENAFDPQAEDNLSNDVEEGYIEELQIDHDDFLSRNDVKKKEQLPYRGTPDPSVPMSNTPCYGCGALLHCQNPGILGYMPSQKFTSIQKNRLREHLCQRCFFMKAYDVALDASVSPEEYKQIIEKIKDVRALVIVVVDVTDMPNSIFPNLSELIGSQRPLYIVGNKADLLPRDGPGYLQRTKDMLMKLCEESGLASDNKIQHVTLISAKTGYGIEDLVTKLMVDWSMKGHVCILGCTNVGKSTLFNSLLMSDYCKETAIDYIKRATTSLWPGTTLNLLKFPVIRPAPWKLIRRSKRLKKQKTEEEEERNMRLAAYRDSRGLKNITLMGHVGQTFESDMNLAVRKEDSMGYSGASFSFESSTGNIVAKNYDRHNMMGRKYDESIYEKSRWCYDTPGVVNPQQIINKLTQHELSVVLSNEIIMPRSFILKPGQSMLVSGLSRIDYVEGDKTVYFTVFAAERIPVKVRDIDDMEEFYNKHIGTHVLGIPIGDSERLSMLPPLVGTDMTVRGITLKESAADVLLSSIGWAAVTVGEGLEARLRVYTPGGLGCSLRTPALLPFAINLRGKRCRPGRGKKVRPPSYQVKPLPLLPGEKKQGQN